jgi:hypothetical protein
MPRYRWEGRGPLRHGSGNEEKYKRGETCDPTPGELKSFGDLFTQVGTPGREDQLADLQEAKNTNEVADIMKGEERLTVKRAAEHRLKEISNA